MCFSPQRRAFFQHLNFKKCSHHEVFWACSLQNVLFATAACIFSTSELTKALRTRHVLYIFTSKCAFRHSGVQFLISPLTTWLRTRRFNRPTFRLTRHTNHWKNTALRDFSNIWRECIFFLRTFALVHLFTFDLTACLICFSTLHIVGSFYLNFLRLKRNRFYHFQKKQQKESSWNLSCEQLHWILTIFPFQSFCLGHKQKTSGVFPLRCFPWCPAQPNHAWLGRTVQW